MGHVFAHCPYHALTKATNLEERSIAEREIIKNRALARQLGKKNKGGEIYMRPNQDGNQEFNAEQGGGAGAQFDIGRDACFRCGRTGHTSKECTYEDTRMCFVCGGIGHVAKKCPIREKKKEAKKRMREEKN
ncbi:MAG: hypothetical protein EZS28_029206 [Streblomastix strix]|nr:MAG: hypothetical protein EZS28_029206 [Streblomastix strix]